MSRSFDPLCGSPESRICMRKGVTAAFIMTRSWHLRSYKPPTYPVAVHESVAAEEGEDDRERVLQGLDLFSLAKHQPQWLSR